MRKVLLSFIGFVLLIITAIQAGAQAYSNAVVALNPVAYWPLTETTQPPFGAYIATNLGTAGAAGNGFYETWFQPLNTGTNTLYYQTNNITHTNGAIADGDTAFQGFNNGTGTGGYVVFPRTTNGVVNPAITIVPPFSVEFWVKPTTLTAGVRPIVNQGRVPIQDLADYGYATTNNKGFCIGQFNGNAFFAVWNNRGGNNPHVEADAAMTANVWQHMVATFNGTNLIWYRNGAQAATANTTGTANSQGALYVPDLISPLLIGSGSIIGAGNGGSEFDGGIDEVAIYPQVLPASTILNHYNAATNTDSTYKNTVLADNPQIYVRLDEPAYPASNYPDRSTYPIANNYGLIGAAGKGYYQPGTQPGAAGPQFTGFGPGSKAVAINGYSGAVDIGGGSLPSELNPTGAARVSVAAWFRSNPADAPARFQEIASHGSASWRISMDATAAGARFNPGNGPELQFLDTPDILTNGCLVNDGNWHFVAGVSDGATNGLYIDGVLARTGTSVGSITGSTLDALLGGSPNNIVPVYNGSSTSEPRYFDGQVAHVAVFTNSLTAAQIQQLYSVAAVPPFIFQQPRSQTNNAGTSTTLFAGVRGSATLGYQWYKNNAPLGGATSSNLTFSPLVASNGGSYYVVVTNSAGSVTSSVASLTVFGPPTVQQQSLTDVRVFVGTTPKLFVTAAGPSLTYQWTRNGSPLADGTNSSYTVTNTGSIGSATYGCTITNIYDTASINPITVSVIAAPTAPYPVAVLGSAPAAYFRLNENPDNGSGNNGTTAYDNAGGMNGVYTNVALAQPGYNTTTDPSQYAVELGDFPPNNNLAGNVPTYLTFGTTNGGNAQFSVEAWINQYLYLNGGSGIVALGYGNGGEQFVLDTGASGGALRFFVRNAAGQASLANSSFVPTTSPGWHHVAGVCDEAGGQVRLYLDGALVASGSITPGSGILSSSLPMTIGARQSGNSSPANYDFQFIGKLDEVAIYNRSLSASEVQNHYLASGIAPTITSFNPSSLTTNSGAAATFTATVLGTAPLGYQWTDPNSNPIGQNTNVLTLSNLQTTQSGTYTLTVMNSYGTATTNFTLQVDAGAPQMVSDLQPLNVMVYAGDPVTLSWQVSGTQPLSYKWYLNGGVINGASNSGTYTITALPGTNTYQSSVTNSYSAGAGGPLFSSVATVIGVPTPTLNPASFTDKLKIRFAGYDRGETLRDFPVLVKLGTNIAGFSYSHFASPTGGDLRFADASGTRALPFEIDEFNDINGVSTIWVQMPRLSGTNDFIWAYWGNPAGTSLPSYATNGATWLPAAFENLPGYQIVYHLKESALPFADSTLQHPATNGVATVPTNGMVGTAGTFGGFAWLDAGTNDVGDAFTLSAWVNIPPGTLDIDSIWVNKRGGFSQPGFALFVNTYQNLDQKIDFATGNGTAGNESTTSAGTVPFGSWHLVTVAANRTNHTAQFYLDGAGVLTSSSILTDFPTLNDLRLGIYLDNAFDFRGAMDEARVQSGVTSSNWVWASWATVAQNSTFANYSSVTSSIVTLTCQVSGNNLILSWPQGTLQSGGLVNGTYTNVTGATSPYTNSMSAVRQFYRVKVQ